MPNNKIGGMEKSLNLVLNDLIQKDGVTGVVVSDQKGLCFGVRGDATANSCGSWAALMSEGCKLAPELPPPVLVFENSTKRCTVVGRDNAVLSIYSDKS